LLDFLRGELGLRGDEGGIRGLKDGLEVELVAQAAFCLAAPSGGDGLREVASADGVSWVFSTFDLDRFDERVDPLGWDFGQFLKNPVVQWAHRYDIPAIGKAEGLYADKDGLHGSVIFNDRDYDSFGWAIGERVRHGVIRAGSVGFRVLEVEIPAQKDGGETALIFRKQELLEFSICNVPANPFALAEGDAARTDAARHLARGLEAASGPGFWGGFIGE
jgi:HK97 family phage prohead protease